MEQNNKHPLVAIKCLVFNHEPYLRDCLEGFVMQQTDFPFVAIVHDDASTDKSADIIREYAEKYPNIIRPIYETENQYSKGDGSIGRIMNAAMDATGAKYIAMCEGDDYWTDPYKLQKQVDFLGKHLDYSMCFHACKTLFADNGRFGEEMVRPVPPTTSIQDLARGNFIHTLSVVYRRYDGVEEQARSLGMSGVGDYPLWTLLAQHGLIYKFDEIMGVYRYGNGVWASTPPIAQNIIMVGLLNRLRMVVENRDVQTEFDKQMNRISDTIISEYHKMDKENQRIRHSAAYKLGKFLLRPLSWLKRKLR